MKQIENLSELEKRYKIELDIYLSCIQKEYHKVFRSYLEKTFGFIKAQNFNDNGIKIFKFHKACIQAISKSRPFNFEESRNEIPINFKMVKTRYRGILYHVPQHLQKIVVLLRRNKIPLTTFSGLINPFKRTVIHRLDTEPLKVITRGDHGSLREKINEDIMSSPEILKTFPSLKAVVNGVGTELAPMGIFGKNSINGPKIFSLLRDIVIMKSHYPELLQDCITFMELSNELYSREIFNLTNMMLFIELIPTRNQLKEVSPVENAEKFKMSHPEVPDQYDLNEIISYMISKPNTIIELW
jgi:hypothetical protein